MVFSSFFYEIEIKALLDWREYRAVKDKRLGEFKFVRNEYARTEVFRPGNSMFKINKEGLFYVVKDEGDRLCKRVHMTSVEKENFRDKVKRQLALNKRMVLSWNSLREVYHTRIEGNEYEIYLERIENFASLLKVKHKRKHLDDIGKHAFRIRRLIVGLGLEAITPSMFREKVKEYQTRLRYSN